MQRPGFSLVELLLVLGLIALLISVSLPAYSSFYENICLTYAARQVAGDLRACQQKAIAQQDEVKVVFSGNYYSLPAGRTAAFAAGIKALSSIAICFSSTGFPPPGGSGTVVLSSRNLRTKKIIVSSSGRIRIE